MTDPSPLEALLVYLRDCSEGSVQAFMVKQLELAAELEKQMKRDMAILINFKVNAEFANALIHDAEALKAAADMRQKVFRFEETRDIKPEPETKRDLIPARRGRPADRYRTKDVA